MTQRHLARLSDAAGAFAGFICYAAPGLTPDRDKATRFVNRAVACGAASAFIYGDPAAFWPSERESAKRAAAAHKGWTYDAEPVQ